LGGSLSPRSIRESRPAVATEDLRTACLDRSERTRPSSRAIHRPRRCPRAPSPETPSSSAGDQVDDFESRSAPRWHTRCSSAGGMIIRALEPVSRGGTSRSRSHGRSPRQPSSFSSMMATASAWVVAVSGPFGAVPACYVASGLCAGCRGGRGSRTDRPPGLSPQTRFGRARFACMRPCTMHGLCRRLKRVHRGARRIPVSPHVAPNDHELERVARVNESDSASFSRPLLAADVVLPSVERGPRRSRS